MKENKKKIAIQLVQASFNNNDNNMLIFNDFYKIFLFECKYDFISLSLRKIIKLALKWTETVTVDSIL